MVLSFALASFAVSTVPCATRTRSPATAASGRNVRNRPVTAARSRTKYTANPVAAIAAPPIVAEPRRSTVEAELDSEEAKVLPRPKAIPGFELDEPGDLVTRQERAEFQKIAEEIDRARRHAEAKLPTVVTD